MKKRSGGGTAKSKSGVLVSSTLLATSRSPSTQITPSTISDLKNQVSSFSDSIKRELVHSEILKEFEASHSRISKRFKMRNCCSIIFLVALSFLIGGINASIGDSNPHYKSCVEQCEITGCIGSTCFQNCRFLSECVPVECQYHCMLEKEREREMLGLDPVKYHGKWPFRRVFGIQELFSVVFSHFNLVLHLHGWLSFYNLLYKKLPIRPEDGKTYYEYSGLWLVYGFLAINAWFWSLVSHIRYMDLTEQLDYSSAVALLGYGLMSSILRALRVRDGVVRVMIAAPLVGFVISHIIYLNFYKFDYGLNMKVRVIMGVAQLLIWTVWGGLSRHPSRKKLWMVTYGSVIAMLLELSDFPPYKAYIDGHALSHAATVPLTYLWWSFLKYDAKFTTRYLLKKVK